MEEKADNKQGRKARKTSQAPEPIAPLRTSGYIPNDRAKEPEPQPKPPATAPKLFMINSDQLIEELGWSEATIEQFILAHGLPVWDSTTRESFNIDPDEYGYSKGRLLRCVQEGPLNRFMLRAGDIEEYQKRYRGILQEFKERSSSVKPDDRTDAQEVTSINSIKRENSGLWYICFKGHEARIKHMIGLQYIAYLLERPGTAVSCINLSHAANPPETTPMTSDRAAADGLHIATNSRLEHDYKEEPETKKVLWREYQRLHNDIETADSEIERKETELEMNMIMQSLQSDEGKLQDSSNSKAQANVKRSIARAITTIGQAAVTDLSAYLENNIKADGRYGYVYSGAPWKITL